MTRKLEETEVKYCDICGQKEDFAHSISTCWKCGKDVCPQHHSLVHLEGGINKMFTYLCTPDRDEMEAELETIFARYSEKRPS